MKLKKDGLVKGVLFQIVFFILSLLSFSIFWTSRNFGNIGMEEIIFHINVPLKGASQDYIRNYILTALCPSVLVWAIEWIVFHFPTKYIYYFVLSTKSRWMRLSLYPIKIPAVITSLLCLIWLTDLFYIADKNFEMVKYLKNLIDQSELIKSEYVSPLDVDITFPQQKRNLIWIFMESAETSSQDVDNGGFFDVNIIPELTQIAKDNISFSQSDLIEGAFAAPGSTWTIAALVAQTSGLPLKGINNDINKYASFMPGAVSLGEILEAQGYQNYFMAGSNFNFGGRRSYFVQHGNYEIFDLYTAREEGKIPSNYKVWWGFEDAKLYAYAKEKLLKLSLEEEPFNFSMLTVDTHATDGYLCELCPDVYNNQYSNVWACASSQVDEFVKWIQQQDFYEDTTIVITGDHCSMDPDFYGDLDFSERKVYNAIVNPAIQPDSTKNRKYTTMDFFPTVLASIGVSIEGNRLGLGTNLFSEEETLSEKYGNDVLSAELKKKSVFYDRNILYP